MTENDPTQQGAAAAMPEPSAKSSSFAARKMARLTAVQALYQETFGEEDLTAILKRLGEDFRTFLAESEETEEGGESEGMTAEAPDAALLTDITMGVSRNRAALEEMVAGALSEKFSLPRMERLLRITLLCGAFELHHHEKIPAAIIISDYVDVARAFFGAKEPSMVNAVLDRLGKTLR